MEEGKYFKAAEQLQLKRGPYYDRWKAAMEARGEQKRCGGCKWCQSKWQGGPITVGHIRCRFAHPGRFACKWFDPKVEG